MTHDVGYWLAWLGRFAKVVFTFITKKESSGSAGKSIIWSACIPAFWLLSACISAFWLVIEAEILHGMYHLS